MTRCKNDTLISTIGVNKLQKKAEVDFSVINYLPDCRKIRANKYVNEVSGTFDRFAKPVNQFECVREGCVNSGTFYNGGVATVYKAKWDAVEFADGVVTFYTKGTEGTLTFMISDTEAMTNADQYTVDLSKLETAADGYKAVVIDLSKTPTQVGTGWTPNHVSAFISIAIAKASGESDADIGISSIAVYDSIEDFESTSSIIIQCLSQLGGSWDVESVEATCHGNGGYDTENIDTIEMTITGKALTPNYQKLNPLWGKGEAVVGWDKENIESTIEAGTGDDAGYGVVVLSDKMAGECGFMSVARAEDCNITDAHMIELNVPGKVDVDTQHYFVIDNEDGSATVYFNEALVGQTVVISYPREADVEEYVYDVDNAMHRKTRMSYTKVWTDGVKYRYVFDNVLITSFPDEVTDEETEFEFTIAIQKDATGRFGRAYRILG